MSGSATELVAMIAASCDFLQPTATVSLLVQLIIRKHI